MAERLRSATSPYLRQHADNPVDWWPWSDAAFAEARRRDVPVLLSVGYAACHWCHVMAHESFEDDEVAAVINAGFVPIKVDREERPDVDAVYMAATTAMTGQGGWPMTAFLTPDGEAFHCGTYFPRDPFLEVLGAVRDAWADARDAVAERAGAVTEAIARTTSGMPAAPLDDAELAAAVETLSAEADTTHGGFGGAPKFPPSMTLDHLLRHHARTGNPEALAMVERTAEAMARGGIYDQLGGGFARYAVDAAWVVPHFEKMLADNAQLLGVYARLWRATGSELAERVAHETASFILRDLSTASRGFASSLDADTVVDGHGVEGLTYVWTPAQLREVLGDDDGARAAQVLGVTEQGTFEHGASTLQMPGDPDPDWWADVRARLRVARLERPQPHRDDKVVTAWNGIAIATLADAGAMMDQPLWVAAARQCATYLLSEHVVEGRLYRASRGGVVGDALAVAADHGDLVRGLLCLHQATGEAQWLESAVDLLDRAIELFGAGEDGGFYDVGSDAERLVVRPRDPSDGAEPSGQSAMAEALFTAAALTGSTRYRELAESTVQASGTLARRAPRFAGGVLAAAEALADGPRQVAVVGARAGGDGGVLLDASRVGVGAHHVDDDGDSGRAAELLHAARRAHTAGAVVVPGMPDMSGVPLLADRPLVDGGPAAYVCRGFVCDRPVTTPEEVTALLQPDR
ncbi:thioredoxin domain-containing protein [Isoptericola sediminis]|uniref:Thioredoxin domain-containing protein n=1 Tax=Isoptericola sediminis TaxID=2733572 RepID=A0A849K622_9MICO|nr:thioredoxin domain-containing protein [Isoptericola sediminis]NNU26597.1 thioredoxin domain-containing protein [Isoptericola sediminis]